MRLSENKIDHLANRVVDRLWDNDYIDFTMQEDKLRQGIAVILTDDLRIEDEISNEAIDRIESYKRDIPYGSDEWQILKDRFFEEIAERRGYTI